MKSYVNAPSTYITVSNYDKNSLDISSELFNTNTVHAQLEECNLSEYGNCNVFYKGTGLYYSIGDSSGEDLGFTVHIIINNNFVQLQLQIEDPLHPNLANDVADIVSE